MEIKGPNINSYPTQHPTLNKDTKQLQTGQILKAVVVKLNSEKVLFELIEPKLSITLEASANSSLKQGQMLSLQVIKMGPPMSLNVLEGGNTLIKSNNTLNAALRVVIPKQTSMSQLLSNLHYLSIPNLKLNETFPQEILDMSRVAFQRLPSIGDIKSASGIKDALISSGVFLEQQLKNVILNNSNTIKNDTRTSLLRLAASIRSLLSESTAVTDKASTVNTKSGNGSILINNSEVIKNQSANPHAPLPHTQRQHHNINELQRSTSSLSNIQQTNLALNELLRNIETSLAKIQHNQLQHFIPDDQSKINWFFDLPVRREDGSDIFRFKFSQGNDENNTNDNNEWSVTLSFDLEKLGLISIQIYLHDNKIGATVWAKKQGTYQLFNTHLYILQKQMEDSGITVSNIRCNKGEIPQTETNKPINLLDEKV